MEINFKTILVIFSDFLADTSASPKFEKKLDHMIKASIEINQKLWNLEDSVRMIDLGAEYVAKVKQEIDKTNQSRNDLIRQIDTEIEKQIKPSKLAKQFYSETPGMIIDRLAILFIKLSVIEDLLLIIKEKDLRQDYLNKKKMISMQITRIGNFLDSYLAKIKQGKVFFEIQQPVKIYNDNRIKRYIKLLQRSKNDS